MTIPLFHSSARAWPGLSVCLALSLLTGCASPNSAAPSVALMHAQGLGAQTSNGPWPQAQWWQSYGDAPLDQLVQQALATQPTLQATLARLRQAQAQVDGVGAAAAVQVNAGVDLSDQRFSKNGLYPPPLAGAIYWNNNAQISASYDLDLFGRQRAALDSAIGQLRAAQAEAQAARVVLISGVVNGYVQLARLVETQAIAEQTLAQREQLQALVQQRVQAGLDTSAELRQAQGTVAQARLELAALDEALVRARHALAELSGQGPHALDALKPRLTSAVAAAAYAVPSVLPADLLGRRADLVAQRWRVEAAAREVDVARAQFYPNINLSAFVGLSSLGLERFVQSGSLGYGVGPALRLPLFDGGRLRANLSAHRAEVDAAIDAYNAALLRALREVADELGSLQALAAQQQAQTQATAAAEANYALAQQRYRAGLGNRLVVLNAQSAVLAQQRASIDLQTRQLASRVALNRALGGGFEADATLAALK